MPPINIFSSGKLTLAEPSPSCTIDLLSWLMAEHRSANKGRLTHGRSRISLGDRSRNILGRYFNGYLAIGLSCAVWNLQHWTQASSLYTCMCTHVDVQYACTYVLCMYERDFLVRNQTYALILKFWILVRSTWLLQLKNPSIKPVVYVSQKYSLLKIFH